MKDRAGPEPFERARPLRSVAQTDGIVVPVRVAKPQHQASCCLEPQRVDELLAQQAHGGRAQDDDALLVQPDDALIGAEIENLGEVEVLQIHRLGRRQSFHITLWAHSSDMGRVDPVRFRERWTSPGRKTFHERANAVSHATASATSRTASAMGTPTIKIATGNSSAIPIASAIDSSP